MMPNVADYIVTQLATWGVERIYGVCGDAIFGLLDAIARDGRITFIDARHESCAAFMASAEAKLTGRPAVVAATSGPGVANLINGLADAYADGVPLLCITGQVPSDQLGTGAKHDIDQNSLLRPLAGYSTVLTNPRALPVVLARALRAACQGGVGHLAVPGDVFFAEFAENVRPPEFQLNAAAAVNPAALAEAVRRLGQAERPMLLIGHGARGAAADVTLLAERIGAPVMASLGGKGIMPGSHPLYVGGLGKGGSDAAHRLLAQADLLLIIGSTWWPEQFVPADLPVVQVDKCPANIGLKQPTLVPLTGDAAEVVPRLLAGLLDQQGASIAWLRQVEEERTRWLAALEHEVSAGPVDGEGIHPAFVVHQVHRFLPRDAVVSVDTGDHTLWVGRHVHPDRAQFLFSGTWRTMGYGLPAAIAAKLAAPHRPVVAVVGDGGLGMSLTELLTARRHGAGVTVLVMNNGCLAMEVNKMQERRLTPLATDLTNPDFAAVALACGVPARKVLRPGELEPALLRALDTDGGPVLLDIAVSPAPVPVPYKPATSAGTLQEAMPQEAK
jgi:pyruvate oxidase